MRRLLSTSFRRFRKEEDGNASVEFFIIFPVFVTMMLMSVELSFITLRHTMLERGLDIAVRQIRLGTGEPSNHAEIKDVICESAFFIQDYKNQLRLEMKPLDLRSGPAQLDGPVLCTENAEPVDPAIIKKDFEFGGVNELMVLRACFRYSPMFPEELIGSSLEKDAHGDAAIVSMTAFVQEPT